MDYAWIIPLLSLLTLLAVAIFALVSKVEIEDRRDDPAQPKSTLAKDGPQGGVAFLIPLAERPHRVPDVPPVLD